LAVTIASGGSEARFFLAKKRTKKPLPLIPTGLDPDSCGIGVASVPAQKASGSFF
jgi:hypothetical protein